MIPGPVTVDDEVLHEFGQPVRPHYGAKWTALYNQTRELLQQVMQTEAELHILVGSGSSGLDAAVGSLTRAGETAVIGSNGYFGERLQQIAESYGLEVVVVESPPTEPLDPAGIEAALEQHPEAAIVGLVHHETATSVVNPVQQIAAITNARDVPLFVDTISSLGGIPYAMDAWGVDVTVAASQKCLGAPPGVAPIAASERAWEIMQRKADRGRGWYLNLQTWRRFAEEWGRWHPHPITIATNTVLALRVGLQQLLAEGVEQRIAYYTGLAKRLRAGLRELGFEPVTPDEALSPVLTAIYAPDGVHSHDIVRYLREQYDVMISGGLGEGLSDRVFRIGHMSKQVTEADIDQILEALRAFQLTVSAAA